MTQALNVYTEYDSKYDIMYLIVGDPAVSDAEYISKGVYIRRDMVTERISGVIIEDYSKKNRECLSQILPMGLGDYLPTEANEA
jgi:hypothetical protein